MRRRVLEAPLGLWVDPQSAYLVLFADASDAFWLDCGPGASAGLSAMGQASAVLEDRSDAPITRQLREGLAAHRDVEAGAGAGFCLGWVGWFAYEFRARTMGEPHVHAPRHPDAVMLFVDRAVTFDHEKRTVTLLALGERWTPELCAWRDEVRRALEHSAAVPPAAPAYEPAAAGVVWAHADDEYLGMIDACQAAIREGHAYQLCLTTSARVEAHPDPLAAYLALRAVSPAHHGAFLRHTGLAILSSSPELFLAVTPDGAVTTRPIKGTRRRGDGEEADLLLAHELRESEKEQAENLMIVDLMRNDLSRVCEVGSVTVSSLFAVETYPQVHQLVSTVSGHLRPDADAIDAIETCFPAGSMTGAPKLEATRILDRLEARPRGVYSGALGHLGLDGRLDLAMVIRTIVIDDDGATVGAGGGITALSQPEEELAEVKLKAAALLGVLVTAPDAAAPQSSTRRVSA